MYTFVYQIIRTRIGLFEDKVCIFSGVCANTEWEALCKAKQNESDKALELFGDYGFNIEVISIRRV